MTKRSRLPRSHHKPTQTLLAQTKNTSEEQKNDWSEKESQNEQWNDG